jgi:hypothetical protein
MSWLEQVFWILCIVAILGAAWWAKRSHEHDQRRPNDHGAG